MRTAAAKSTRPPTRFTTTPGSAVTASTSAMVERRPPSFARTLLVIAGRELREAMCSRWFVLYTIAFALLGLGVSHVSATSAGGSGLSGFGRTTAGLINLTLLVVPLMALTAGSGSIVSDRERGMLSFLLAQPMTRLELLWGRALGLAGALLASITLGLGVCAAVLAGHERTIGGSSTEPWSLIWLAALSFLLALSLLGVGLLVSVSARRSSVAGGVSIFLWLMLVFVSDLGLMAGAVAMQIPIEELFALSLANPLQVFRMWSIQMTEASLDVLGPAGLYASEEFGDRLHLIFGASMALWIAGPIALASLIFSRRSMP